MAAGEAVAAAVGAVALAGVSAATARRPNGPIPSLGGYLERWTALHGGHDPRHSRLTRSWLHLVYRLARPLARAGVQPNALTLWSAEVAALAYAAVAAGARWVLLAALAVAASGLIDNLDGAVAVLLDRVSRFGSVLDSFVDRLVDAGYLIVLWRLGGPAGLMVAAGSVVGLLEYTRARAGVAGMTEIAVVTVGERPTRVILTAVGLLTAGLFPARAATAAVLTGWAILVVGVVATVQLLAAARRSLA